MLPDPVASIMQAPPVVVTFGCPMSRCETWEIIGCASSFTGIIFLLNLLRLLHRRHRRVVPLLAISQPDRRAEIFVLVMCWKSLKCSFASAVWPERCSDRAIANSDEACSGLIASACFEAPRWPCRTASSPRSRRPQSSTSPHPWDRTSPPAESWPAPRPARCPRAAPGPGCTTPADCRGSSAMASRRDFLASASFCSVISAMPSLIAGLRQLRILLECLRKGLRGALGELLAHQRHAAIVQPDRLRIVVRLRRQRPSPQETQGPQARPFASISSPKSSPTRHPASEPCAQKSAEPFSVCERPCTAHRLPVPSFAPIKRRKPAPIYTSAVIPSLETLDWSAFLGASASARCPAGSNRRAAPPAHPHHRRRRLHRLGAGPAPGRACALAAHLA